MLCRTWRDKYHFITMPSGYRRMDTPSKRLGQEGMISATINNFLSQGPDGAFSPNVLVQCSDKDTPTTRIPNRLFVLAS